MNAYRFSANIPESHTLEVPEDIPSGPAEIVVLLSEEPQAVREAGTHSRPIWEVFEETMKDVPSDVLASLPPDGAEQHDHYIYGTSKRRI